MVKEIAEHGQFALEASTLAVDPLLPSSNVAMLYGRAAGVNMLELDALRSGPSSNSIECGYLFVYTEAEHFAQGALLVLAHIRTTVSV